jgi:hypothetical protein
LLRADEHRALRRSEHAAPYTADQKPIDESLPMPTDGNEVAPFFFRVLDQVTYHLTIEEHGLDTVSGRLLNLALTLGEPILDSDLIQVR